MAESPAYSDHSLHDRHRVAREAPELVVVGAEVGEIRTFAPELSAPLRAAVPAAVRLVLRECAHSGLPLH